MREYGKYMARPWILMQTGASNGPHMMRIMVVGGAGFLGINIARALVHPGYAVYIVDKKCQHLKHKKHLAGVLGFYDSNVADSDTIIKLVEKHAIDCVINLVSTLIPSSGTDCFLSEVGLCTLPAFQLIPQLAKRGVKYVFVSSGGTIYGPAKSHLVSESDECQPVTYYGYSKLMLEEYIKFCGRTHGLEYLLIRPSNPYGMYQNPLREQGFVAVAMDRLLKGEAIEIWGDGSVVRDYIWASDLANALTMLLGKNVWNTVFNIGSGTGHSLLEVLRIMDSITGKQIKVVHREPRSVDVPRIVLNISKLKNVIDFRPIGLSDGLKTYHALLLNETI